MLEVFYGDDGFAIHEALGELVREYDGETERVDGTQLALRDLPDLLMSSTLFSTRRLVVIRDLSENSQLWQALPDWLARVSDDVRVVCVEAKLDKRTATYKTLKKANAVREFVAWTVKDRAVALKWLSGRLGSHDKSVPAALLDRVGYDKWTLSQAAEVLSLKEGTVTASDVEALIEKSTEENIFAVFESALRGDAREVKRLVDQLKIQQDPYTFFGLLSSQAVQLYGVAVSRPSDAIEKDLGIHPFVAKKMAQFASRLSLAQARMVLAAVAEADADMKLSKGEPWLLVERALLKIASV